MRGELGGGADRSAGGGGASSAVGQTGGVYTVTGSLVLVLAVYRALSLLLSMASIVVHC